MASSNTIGYAFIIALPREADADLRRWTETTPGASWDVSGGHVTLARLTGDLAPEDLVESFRAACVGLRAFDVGLCRPAREEYWDKPGLEIVMLVGAEQEDVAGILELRERLLASLLPRGVRLAEGDSYVPHITLTTGLPPARARALERAAAGLELRFTANEVVFWSGGEASRDGSAGPPWRVIDRVQLA